MRIVAFNVTHDSSVCSLKDGEIEFFCKEERLSKVKRDKHPFLSLNLYKSLDLGPVDHVLYHTPSNNEVDAEQLWSIYMRKYFNVYTENYSSLQHHMCHAAMSYFNSEFEKALVFVIDRNGSFVFVENTPMARESESVFLCDNERHKSIYKSFAIEKKYIEKKNKIKLPLSNFFYGCDLEFRDFINITRIYEAATTLIGQDSLENGKTMGLSSYGEDKKYETLSEKDFMEHANQCLFKDEQFKIKLELTKEDYQYHANRAKQVQLQTQNMVADLIEKYVNKTGVKNICLVGGYGLNVVANQFFLKKFKDCNFYFEPLADDTGVPIGAAMLKYNILTGKKPKPCKDTFFHYYKKEEFKEGEDATLNDVCDLLINQKSVAIFEGSPEAGPRALGHRSILFDPRNFKAKEIINNIKKREWYRPFAGVILQDHFEKHFETPIKKSPHMTVNFNCKNNLFPGITHIDKTCRVQTVESGTLFDLLSLFYSKTKCPVLLNTSFNLAGRPLVHDINDAIKTFNMSSLDAVYFVDSGKLLLR